MEIKQLKIDFGSGLGNKYEAFKKCDILNNDDIDYGGIDFNCDKLPFLDNSIDEAISCHTLEHIENVKHFLNELHRVIKKGSYIQFIVPYALHAGSYKPVHKHYITECWFDFLRKHHTEAVYGFKRWDIISGSIKYNRDREGNIYEIELLLTPIK